MTQTADEFMRSYEQASNDHDIDTTLELIDDRAIYLFSDESVHVGKAAIEQALRRNFGIIQNETYAIDNLTWLAKTDEIAACVYEYAWSGTVNGEPASGSGRGTTILQRRETRWKILHEHLSRGALA
jgi:ketosteroid isomerase-like protein